MSKKIIALTGLMGRGKTTVLKILQEKYPNAEYIKFAEPLYKAQEAVYKSLGIDFVEGALKDRKLLQVLGTEWGRSVDENFWVSKWQSRVEQSKAKIILTDDCRFLNEANAVKALGGEVWKVVGPARGEFISNEKHASELEIDKITPTYRVFNEGNEYDLESSIQSIINHSNDKSNLKVKVGGKV